MIVIDSLKGEELYKSLQQYNVDIERACKGFKFTSGEYDVTKKSGSFWFDPRCVRDLSISHVYPKCLPVQKDSRFCLTLYAPNYFALMLINELYGGKNPLIEEQAAGMGCLLFYLNKLGFSNFNLVDNFSQLPKELMESMMNIGGIVPHLNYMECIPEILVLIGYTYFVKPIYKETDLIITYNNVRLITEKEDGTLQYLYQNLESYTPLENKVLLAVESNGLTKAYCNKEKYEEYKEKLLKYGE